MVDTSSRMARQIISLGSFCMPQWIIQNAGFRQPTYPFDDIFSSVGTVTHALDDGFATFLDADDYLRGSNDHNWVPRLYAEQYGQTLFFVHHDMRDDDNRAKFSRRVQRLMALKEGDNPLFVLFDYADRLPPADMLMQLKAAVGRRFGRATILVATYGASPPAARRDLGNEVGMIFRHFMPISSIAGLRFVEDCDNEVLIAFVREAYMLSDG